MLTFSHLGGQGVRITGGAKPVSVYPPKINAADISLMPAPEEDQRENVVSWPGEYDYAGITIRGIGHSEGQQVSDVVEIDGVRCAFPSSPLQEWTDADIGKMGDVHILVLPAENPKVAQSLLEDVDPRLLILVPGKNGKLDPEVVKHCGGTGKAPVDEFKVKGTFSAEGREVMVFGT